LANGLSAFYQEDRRKRDTAFGMTKASKLALAGITILISMMPAIGVMAVIPPIRSHGATRSSCMPSGSLLWR
jgi:hypothetical protein